MTTHHAPLFISHGSPMTALEPGAAGAFWQRLGLALQARADAPGGALPTAFVMFSAHSLARLPVVLGAAHHEAVHDFGGFPAPLYALRYPAPGAPALAERARALLQAAGIEAHASPEGGLDHGIWTPLRSIRPQGDIPVLPIAFPPTASPRALFALGAALQPLVDEGALLIGSGSITHNLRLGFGAPGTRYAPEQAASAAFRQWFVAHAAAADWPALWDYRRQAPEAVHMHPTDEHLLPWFIAAGAGGEQAPARRLHDSVEWGHLGMDVYAFGAEAESLARSLAD